MGCCCSSAAHSSFVEINEAEESRVRRIWKEKWGGLSRVMHVLRPKSASDSAFGVIVRLYALQVRREAAVFRGVSPASLR